MGSRQHKTRLLTCFLFAYWVGCAPWTSILQAENELPDGFVYLNSLVPTVVVDLRYYTQHNFVGERIDGYLQPKCIVTVPTAEALAKVQSELADWQLSLKIFDAYRPQRAVDHFVRWARDTSDTRTKAEFYPQISKVHLFRDGYIAEKSGHSRGSTVDLTIVTHGGGKVAEELDMGTPFDFFGPPSWLSYEQLTASQRSHRLLLKLLMEKHGFRGYAKEWWHFTLEHEPFPETYFDFPIQ